MKKLIVAIAVMLSLVSFGQEREGRGKFKTKEDLEVHLKQMTIDLGLSGKQQNEVKNLLDEQFNKGQKMREEMKANKEKGEKPSDEQKAAMKKSMIDNQLEMKTKMKKILTEEQMKKWEQIKKEKRGEMKGKGPRGKKSIEKGEK